MKFFPTIDECLAERPCDVLLMSGVLQCLSTPHRVVTEALAREFEFVIIDKTPFLETGGDMLTVQHVPATIYAASYPAWFFDRDRFLRLFEPSYEKIEEFDWGDVTEVGRARARHKGFLFRRRGTRGAPGRVLGSE